MNIDFYFDFLSPYAYLAWFRLNQIPGMALQAKPVLLAGLLGHYGIKGPAEIESKRLYTFRHVLRLSQDYGVDLRAPASHPFNPLAPLRLVTLLHGEKRTQAVERIFAATWKEGLDVSQRSVLESLFPSFEHGLLDQREGKEGLRAETQIAIERGVFGVPTMFVEDELFWGCDSIEHLKERVDGRSVYGSEALEAFEQLQPSASRDFPGSPG